MEHMLRICLMSVMACSLAASSGEPAQPCTLAQVRAAIEQLRTVELPSPVYIEDGAADGSIVLPSGGETPPSVKTVLTCAAVAAPQLIAYLDDVRPTKILCQTERTKYKSQAVPLGFVCLDLLLVLSDMNSLVTVPDCDEDGLGACVSDGYYFRPDDYRITDSKTEPLPVVQKTKQAWVRLLKAGRLKFSYPQWLRERQ